MVLQGASRVRRERCDRSAQGRTGDFDEMRGEERNVIPPLAQRRDFYHYSAQPIVEVRPKLPATTSPFEILVGGRDHPDVHPVRLPGADRQHLPFLQEPQKHGLSAERQVADLVQKDCPLVRCGQEARPPLHAPP